MGIIQSEGITLCGNFAKIKKGRPTGKNRYGKEYKAIVPFDFKWRAKLGKAECDCVEMLECYQPWYGTDWYHSDECAISKHLKKFPQIQNFYADTDLLLIASTC